MIIFVFLAWALAVDDYEALYNKYHQSRGPNACWGCGVLPFVYKMFPRSSTIVDAGAGSCTVVRALTQQGYNASGVEIFAYPVEHFCTDLRSVVRVSPLHTLPFFRDDEFDVVFSTEVLEHVPEDKIDDTIRELARVGRRFFITVGLSPDSEDHEGASLKFHATVRSSQWWSDKFSQFGLVRDELLWLLFMTHKDEVKAQQVPSEYGFCPSCFYGSDPQFPTLFLMKKVLVPRNRALIIGKGPSARPLKHFQRQCTGRDDAVVVRKNDITVCSRVFVAAINSALNLVDYADLLVANDIENLLTRVDGKMLVARARAILIPSFVHKAHRAAISAHDVIDHLRNVLQYTNPIYIYHLRLTFNPLSNVQKATFSNSIESLDIINSGDTAAKWLIARGIDEIDFFGIAGYGYAAATADNDHATWSFRSNRWKQGGPANCQGVLFLQTLSVRFTVHGGQCRLLNERSAKFYLQSCDGQAKQIVVHKGNCTHINSIVSL